MSVISDLFGKEPTVEEKLKQEYFGYLLKKAEKLQGGGELFRKKANKLFPEDKYYAAEWYEGIEGNDYDTTRLIVDKKPDIVDGIPLHRGIVSWYMGNPNSKIGVEGAWKYETIWLTDLDVDRLELGRDYNEGDDHDYARKVFIDLLDKAAVQSIGGGYVGGVIDEDGKMTTVVRDHMKKILDAQCPRHPQPVNIKYNDANLEQIGYMLSNSITGLDPVPQGEVAVGNITGYTSIGRARENQEDAILVCHDYRSGMEMMAVSDGMGGVNNGEYASNIVVTELKKWFPTLGGITNINSINVLLDEKLKEISDLVFRQTHGGGATLSCAIFNGDQILVANVGDSRIYALANGKLIRVTKDDSIVEELFEKGKIPSREAQRHRADSNIITADMGSGRTRLQPRYTVLDAHNIQKLIGVSDGVSDCISDSMLAVVSKASDRARTAKAIVETAVKHNSKAPEECRDQNGYIKDGYVPYIMGGKDNTSVVVWTKPDTYDDIGR